MDIEWIALDEFEFEQDMELFLDLVIKSRNQDFIKSIETILERKEKEDDV